MCFLVIMVILDCFGLFDLGRAHHCEDLSTWLLCYGCVVIASDFTFRGLFMSGYTLGFFVPLHVGWYCATRTVLCVR